MSSLLVTRPLDRFDIEIQAQFFALIVALPRFFFGIIQQFIINRRLQEQDERLKAVEKERDERDAMMRAVMKEKDERLKRRMDS